MGGKISHTHTCKETKEMFKNLLTDNLASKFSVHVDSPGRGGGTIVGSGSLTFYIGIHVYRERKVFINLLKNLLTISKTLKNYF